jgi:DNA-binding IclR family transcriptional regulator
LESHLNQSVFRALTILDLLGESGEKMGIRDIARRLGMATAICQRLVNTLAQAGYLEQCSESKKYSVGYKAFLVGAKYLARNDIVSASMPELQQLARQHRLNAYLGVLRGGRAVYLATLQSESPIVIRGQPGESIPLHSTALGKSLLLDLSDEEIDREVGPAPYQKMTKKTITSRKQLLEDLKRSRARGFVTSASENLPDVLTVGAPVRDVSGRIVAGISGAIHRIDVPEDEVQAYGEVIAEAALRISQRMGYHPR